MWVGSRGRHVWVELGAADAVWGRARTTQSKAGLECAQYAGLNMENANRVLDGEIVSDDDINRAVDQVHAAGIHSIPQLVFEVEGLAKGSWLTGAESRYRIVHGGSGSQATMKAALTQLHQACM